MDLTKFRTRALTWAALGLLASTATAELSDLPSGTYKLDKTHGYINFSYTHVGFSIPTVGFRNFDVEVGFDSEDPAASTLTVTIDAASVDSRVDEFDNHLRGEDFFNVAVHPEIGFVATGIEMDGAGGAVITGDLTIMDTTKPVTLAATLNKAGVHPMSKAPTMGLNATTTVLRSDWGLGYAVPIVSDAVNINISVELPKFEEPESEEAKVE
jgi:polyisoprenoid-binding protein YceI